MGIDGNKTYIVGAVTIVYGLAGIWLGLMDQTTAGQTILAGLAMLGFRSAMNKK